MSTSITQLRFEHQPEAFGLGVAAPRLSWRVASDTPGWQQSAYELELSNSAGNTRESTGKVGSDQSVLVTWPFAPLTSRQQVGVRVRVWDAVGNVSDWSTVHTAETGLLRADDWSAQFIGPADKGDTTQAEPASMLRREFAVQPGLVRARLYVTALGVYQAEINGQRVGDHVLAPGWTKYDHQLHAQVFDVTGLLRAGANAIGATVADGWYRGRLGFRGGRRNIYGDRTALLAQLELTYADGRIERVVTDTNWRASTGPILLAGIYEGETYDARLERDGWTLPGYNDRDWAAVTAVPHALSTIVFPPGPPVRHIETIKPVAITQSPSGKTLVDFGQNLVGVLRIQVRGSAGSTITLRHAEVLEKGELGVRPLRGAAQTDRYTKRSDGVEIYEPRFTFHGFRYAEVSGWPGALSVDDLEAVVIHSDLERTGWFECSDAMINRLHDNVLWSMRGNFLSIPTDCPQRDERLGWTGDIQVFAPTATFLYQVNGFLESWLSDLYAEQRLLDGIVPVVVPYMLNWPGRAQAAWGDAATIVPTVLHQRYGDVGTLRKQFASMCEWVDYLQTMCGPSLLWTTGFQLGDWLDPAAPPHKPSQAQTSANLVSTACFARSAQLTADAAALLGEDDAHARYAALAAHVREAFVNEYVTQSGRMMSDAQTAYAIALEWALLPTAAQRRHAGDRLAAIAREGGFHIGTGFVGTPVICDALTNAGKLDTAYAMLTEKTCPSWLYPVGMGATTIWERWDSTLPDGSINPGEMTSFNHYALGAVADWMHRVVAGLAPAAPGYKRITFAPRPGGGLAHASAKHISPYGEVSCGWAIKDGQLEVRITVPPNTTGEVHLPGQSGPPVHVGSGDHSWKVPYGVGANRAPLTVDSTLGEFRAVPNMWSWLAGNLQLILKEFIQSQNILMDADGVTIRQALTGASNPDAMLAEMADGLRKAQS